MEREIKQEKCIAIIRDSMRSHISPRPVFNLKTVYNILQMDFIHFTWCIDGNKSERVLSSFNSINWNLMHDAVIAIFFRLFWVLKCMSVCVVWTVRSFEIDTIAFAKCTICYWFDVQWAKCVRERIYEKYSVSKYLFEMYQHTHRQLFGCTECA